MTFKKTLEYVIKKDGKKSLSAIKIIRLKKSKEFHYLVDTKSSSNL